MAGSATNFLENKLLDHALGTTSFTMPENTFVGLYTSAPTDGTGGTEVSGGSYARQAIDFSAAVNGSASNSNAVQFSNLPTATVVAVGIFQSNTAVTNDLLFYSTLSSPRQLVLGDSIRIGIGALVVSLD